MKLLFVHFLISVLFIIILGWNGITTTYAAPPSSNFNIITVDSSPYGKSYSEWIAKWWT
jgi:hypothetical protein